MSKCNSTKSTICYNLKNMTAAAVLRQWTTCRWFISCENWTNPEYFWQRDDKLKHVAHVENRRSFSFIYPMNILYNSMENKFCLDVICHAMIVLNITCECILSWTSQNCSHGSKWLLGRTIWEPALAMQTFIYMIAFSISVSWLAKYIFWMQPGKMHRYTHAHTNNKSGGRAPLSLASRCVTARL